MEDGRQEKGKHVGKGGTGKQRCGGGKGEVCVQYVVVGRVCT